jgi:hypothetical protein
MANRKRGNILFLISVIFIVLAIICYYYFYYSQTINVKNSKGKKIDAIELYNLFSEDSVIAKQDYTQKILEVSGEVIQISKNQQNQTVILLKCGKEGAFINCTMEEYLNTVKVGDKTSLKGICNGIGDGDTTLGIFGDIYLIRCYTANEGK